MHFEASALRPLVRFIVPIDVAHRHHVRRPMGNYSNVVVNPQGPEVRIFRFIQALERESGLRWIHLEIECRLLGQRMVTAVTIVTTLLVMAKVAAVAPAAMVTESQSSAFSGTRAS